MTQITVAGNAFPVWVPGQTLPSVIADENGEKYPEQRYLSTQFDEPLSSERGSPGCRRTPQMTVFAGIPTILRSRSVRRQPSEQPRPDIEFFLHTQSEVVDNKPATGESQSIPVRPLFLLPVTLSEDSKRVVGENGLKRFDEFRSYPDGWDYGRGSPLSAGSVRLLNSFLKELSELAAYEPSLFLTHQGNLQLGWEDVSGNVVELEFFRDRIEYYVEVLNEEGSVGAQDQSQLVEKIRSTVE